MRSGRSGYEDLRIAAGIGAYIAVYLGVAAAFYWLMQPTVLRNYGMAAYKAPPGAVVVYSGYSPTVSLVTSAPPPLPATVAAAAPSPTVADAQPRPQETDAAAAPKPTKKHVARAAPRRERQQVTRERRSPWDFASGPSFGSRPWF